MSVGSQDRIHQIDALRGLIMVFMALDHFVYFVVRFHPSEFWNTVYPDFPADFLQVFRVLSHLCAPGFVFLAGVSMHLAFRTRIECGATPQAVQRRFLVRGALIVLVQLFLEPVAWILGGIGGKGVAMNESVLPGTGPVYVYIGVLFTLGVAMMVGSRVVRLRGFALLAAAVSAVVLSPVILWFYRDPTSPIPWPVGLLAVAGQATPFLVNYPLLPWLGVFLFGILAGRWVGTTESRLLRRRMLLSSLALATLGVVLRFWYPWAEAHGVGSEGQGFWELSKYPPSPAFLALTLSALGLILAGFYYLPRRHTGDSVSVLAPLIVLGREPLFFYFLHLFAYGLLCQVLVLGADFVPVALGWLFSLVPLTVITWSYGRWRQRNRERHRMVRGD